MGLFTTLRERTGVMASGWGPLDDRWYMPLGGTMTEAGTSIGPEDALAIATVYACRRVISETNGSLPIITYRETGDGNKERAKDHPFYRLLHDAPNPLQTALDFKELMTGWAVMRGIACAEIVPDPRTSNPVGALMPIHPDNVTRSLTSASRWRYTVSDKAPGSNAIRRRELDQERVFCLSGPGGQAILSHARESFGLTKSAQRYGSRFFGRGAKLRGVLESDQDMSVDAQEKVGRAFTTAYTQWDSDATAVLVGGLKYKPVGISNEDSQFLETREFQQEEICQWFRVPQHKVGILRRSTNNNIEHQAIEFVQDTVLPWCERWEQALVMQLFAPLGYADEYVPEYLIDQVLRGDTKTRFETYAMGRQWGWYSINDVLRKENMNTIGPEGDVRLMPTNMAPLGWEPGSGDADTTINVAAKINAVGILVRSGYEPADALRAVELDPIEHLGLLPVTLQAPSKGAGNSGGGSAAAEHSRVTTIVREVSGRLVRQEQRGVIKAAQTHPSDGARFADAVEEFYDAHAARIAESLCLPEFDAQRYCERHRVSVQVEGLAALERWEGASEYLANLALAEDASHSATTRFETVRNVERDAENRIVRIVESEREVS